MLQVCPVRPHPDPPHIGGRPRRLHLNDRVGEECVLHGARGPDPVPGYAAGSEEEQVLQEGSVAEDHVLTQQQCDAVMETSTC